MSTMNANMRSSGEYRSKWISRPFLACLLVTVCLVTLYSVMATNRETTAAVFVRPAPAGTTEAKPGHRVGGEPAGRGDDRQSVVQREDVGDEPMDGRRADFASVVDDKPAAERVEPSIDLDRRDVDSDELFRRLVVVTAFSENHRLEAMGMIGTVQKRMPNTRIIAYDLGLNPDNVHTVTALCNVELRPFRYERYPPHVAKIKTYAWKVIIIKETLNEFGAIFWADASVRFLDSLRVLLPFAKEHHGYLSRMHSYWVGAHKVGGKDAPIRHNFYATLPAMFDYMAINRTEYAVSREAPHIAANRQLVVNSTTLQRRLIAPLYGCALDPRCICPPGAKRDNHQFDAAALMLVMYKHLPGEFDRTNDHLADMDSVMMMHRRSDDWRTAQVCRTTG